MDRGYFRVGRFGSDGSSVVSFSGTELFVEQICTSGGCTSGACSFNASYSFDGLNVTLYVDFPPYGILALKLTPQR